MTIELRTLIADHQGDNDYDTATRILQHLRVNQRATAILLPIIANAVTHERRNMQLVVEQVAFAGKPKGRDLRELLAMETFAVGGGRRVAWLDATIEDHQARIEYQQKAAAAVASDIYRHEQAIKLIEHHGVTCLRELPDIDLGDAA